MPEGPSIIIAKESILSFKGKKVINAEGNTKLDITAISGKKITDIRSWGKHLLISFKDFSLRIHFMMFGSYRVNERKDAPARLRLTFKEGEINFYTCSIKFIDESLDEVYDWTSDVLNDNWNASHAKKKLKQKPDELVCDVLLDQNIFSGVGNIIKNEVLFRTRIHPENKLQDLSASKMNELIKEARNYSFDFLKWKKEFVLRKHWLAYTKKICPRDGAPFIKKYCGKTRRRTFYCEVCQVLYNQKVISSK